MHSNAQGFFAWHKYYLKISLYKNQIVFKFKLMNQIFLTINIQVATSIGPS